MTTNIARLVESQAALFHLKDHYENPPTRPGRTTIDGVGYGPCLLISRECGSGGELIAEEVARQLFWEVYDREIVDQLARSTNLGRQAIAEIDERWRSAWDELVHNLLAGTEITDEQYLACLRGVILNLAHQGDAVIIGRGAQHILPPGCGLRVRFVAPIALRAQRLAERDGLSLEKGHERALRIDAERAVFIKRAFNVDVGSPVNYDLVINTADLSLTQAAEIVMAALRERTAATTAT